MKSEIEAGLRRLAFGGVSDGVKLLLHSDEMSDRQLKRLDLFNVSDLKRSSGGVTEIKFYDRLKALEQLADFSSGSGQDGSALLEALRGTVGREKTE